MTFKYTLTFTSHGVDESSLRSAVEALGVINLNISRTPEGALATYSSAMPTVSATQQKILVLLSDNLPHRKFEIIDALGGQDHASEVTKSLSAIVAAGLVKKFKHGIYGSPKTSEAAASALPPRMNKTTADTTYGKVVRMINEHPSTAVQIKERFGFSRQRAEQLLSRAEQRGQIRRVETTGERGHYVYLSAEAALSEIMDRTPELSESRKRVLSTMLPGELYYATELTAFIDTPGNTTKLKSWIMGLAKWGLIYHFSVGTKLFCGITPLGVEYPDYNSSAAKASPVDFISEMGEIKSKFLQAMKVLGGSAKTIELTYALGEEIFGEAGYSSGQVMQRLQRSGLVERISARGQKGYRAFRLTRTGEYVASVIDRFLPPPSLGHLQERIDARLQLKSEKLRSLWGGYSLPPTYRAILKVIVTEGQASTSSIPGKMHVKFANPRSINLAVKTMEERGYISRASRTPKNGIIWQATETGLLEAQKVDDVKNKTYVTAVQSSERQP
jgi:predicted transcriptional regulator